MLSVHDEPRYYLSIPLMLPFNSVGLAEKKNKYACSMCHYTNVFYLVLFSFNYYIGYFVKFGNNDFVSK